jgi:colanic acid biosynthesis glycosyl transferase WcaI
VPSIDLAANGQPGSFHLVYAGNLGPAQGLDTLLDAAKQLQQTDASIVIHLIGTGQSEGHLRERVETEGLTQVRFHPLQAREHMSAILRQANAQLVVLRPDPLFDITIPSKTQTSFAVGRPVVASVGGETGQLVLQAGAGVAAEPGNAKSLAAAVLDLAALHRTEPAKVEQMGDRAAAFYQQHFSMKSGVDATATVVRSVVGDTNCSDSQGLSNQ